MSRHVKIFLFLVVVGVLLILLLRAILPWWQETQQRSTSDAAATRGVLTIGVDNWIGYFPLCSPEMRRNLRARGYALECIEDAADYGERLRKLAEGDLDFAVATVDAYLLNGGKQGFPGVIVAVIDTGVDYTHPELAPLMWSGDGYTYGYDFAYADRANIAQVFVSRLNRGMRLQTDPSVIYGVGSAFDGDLTRRHLRTDTPYNTYTRRGLPPTPIAMAGRAAIHAALHPADGDELFFVATGLGDGSHKFSVTKDEHDAAVAEYLQRLRERRRQGR